MSMLVWVMMGIALWHFAVFVPDRFWGGIVGAFLVAILGSVIFGFVVSGFTVPGQNDTDLASALIAVPGAIVALGCCGGSRRGRRTARGSERVDGRAPERRRVSEPLAYGAASGASPGRSLGRARPLARLVACATYAPWRHALCELGARALALISRHARGDPRRAAGSAIPSGRARFLAADERHDPCALRRDGDGCRDDPAPCRSADRGSSSSATTTSTGSARRRSWCARCAPSAPSRAGICRAA